MFVFLSKLIPLFVYPLGLACMLLLLALLIKRSQAWQTRLVILALVLLWIAGNRWVSYSLARSLEWQYLPAEATYAKSEVIVVLGGGTEAALAPRPFTETNAAGDRVLYAARLFKQGKADHILLSGGNVTFLGERSTTPASQMKEVLVEIGVSADALWLEDTSQNTYENALFTHRILKEKGIDSILLVTSAMHMPRSVALFEKQGFKVTPAPVDYTVTEQGWQDLFALDFSTQLFNLLPNSSSLSLTTNVLKEYIGIWVYRLQGWL